MTKQTLLSVVVPILTGQTPLESLHHTYKEALRAPGRVLQFVYVVDGPLETALSSLKALKASGEPIEILHHAHSFGEATALTTGFRHARGEVILTLRETVNVRLRDLEKLLADLATADLVIARRMPPDGRGPGRQRKFEFATSLLFGNRFHDLRAGVRAMRRAVAEEIVLYGQQHHFLPLIAETHGFVVQEVEVEADPTTQRNPPAASLALLLDLVTAFFLIRFIKRPFRFFGGFGAAILVVGGLVTAWLVFARLFLGEGLVDRPALIFSSLMIVLGIQIISVGLIGEIVTFTFTREHKDHRVERIID